MLIWPKSDIKQSIMLYIYLPLFLNFFQKRKKTSFDHCNFATEII